LAFVVIRLVGMVLRVAGTRWTERGEADMRQVARGETGPA
jgi:hypothetical protein